MFFSVLSDIEESILIYIILTDLADHIFVVEKKKEKYLKITHICSASGNFIVSRKKLLKTELSSLLKFIKFIM